MTGDASLFIKLKNKSSGKVTFDDGMKVRSIGIRDVGKDGETFVQKVLLVDGLNYNPLSVNQLCDKDLFVISKKHECLILDANFNVVFKENRYNDIYIVYLGNLDCNKFKCFTTTCNDP